MAKTDKYASTAMLLESQWDVVNKRIDGKEIDKEEIPNIKKDKFDVKEQGDKARKAKKEESSSSSSSSSSKVQKDKNEESSSDSKDSKSCSGTPKKKVQKDEVEASADVEAAVKIAKKLAAYGEKKEDAVIEKAAKKILELLGVVESESSES
jgi:hypothetical protein